MQNEIKNSTEHGIYLRNKIDEPGTPPPKGTGGATNPCRV
jgi:hypothetical protein